jgi:hypothetical protein
VRDELWVNDCGIVEKSSMEFVSTFCVHVWYVDLVLTCRNVMSRLLAFMVFSQEDTDAAELGV